MGDKICDLYGGVGLFTSPMSKLTGEEGEVHLIERDNDCIKDAKKMHQYVNTSIDSKDKVVHILDGIYFSINVLKDYDSALSEKQFAFKFLVHLVGDAHQPFHAGRSEDKGGN